MILFLSSRDTSYAPPADSPFARLPTTSVAWNLNSSSVDHSAALSPRPLPLPLPFATPLLLFPPFLASVLSSPASGLTTPCTTASSFRCSCPTISFFRLRSALSCASTELGFESSTSAGGIVDRPIVEGRKRVGDGCTALRGLGASVVAWRGRVISSTHSFVRL